MATGAEDSVPRQNSKEERRVNLLSSRRDSREQSVQSCSRSGAGELDQRVTTSDEKEDGWGGVARCSFTHDDRRGTHQ